jgi:hypothetical protein
VFPAAVRRGQRMDREAQRFEQTGPCPIGTRLRPRRAAQGEDDGVGRG